MAKIIKITPAINAPKTANPFKNLHSTTTNPFKYSNFEGNTLQFADVFEGFEPKKYNKLRMIATSVAGSMHKIKTGITEPIVAFARKVKTNIVSAWDYAKNTNVSDLAAVKKFNDIMNTQIEIPGVKALETSIESMKTKVSAKIEAMQNNVIGFGKDITTKWNTMIEKIQPKKITADMPVSELESMWRAEIAAVAAEGAI